MRDTEILMGPYVCSCQKDISWILLISSLSVNMTLKTTVKIYNRRFLSVTLKDMAIQKVTN